MNELWKNIDDLGNTYEVSNLGRIRNKKTGHIKSLAFDGHYYKFGYDCNINGERKRGWYRVHKAVAMAFIPNPENKPTVNHKDGDRKNNKAENLEWATYKEQSQHSSKVLKRNCGEDNYNSQYTNEQVKEMRRLYYEENIDIKILKEKFGGNIRNIKRIIKYERWKNIF